MAITVTMETAEVMEEGTAGEKSECCQKSIQQNLFNFSGPERQDWQKSKEVSET